MKKILPILLITALALTIVSCSKTTPSKDSTDKISDPVELLQTVWNTYSEDETFAAAGGDMSEENMTTDAPGKYGLDDAAAIDNSLGLPSSCIDKIESAASLVHMMNANTFTCGAFVVKDEKDIAGIAAALKDNIMTRQWMCGFPDKLVVVSVDNCIVSFFGEQQIVDTFKDKLCGAYSSASVISEDPIA